MIAAMAFDPDLHSTAGALVTWDPDSMEVGIQSLRMFTVPKELKGQQACALMCATLATQARNWAIQIKDQFPVGIVVAEGQTIHRETKNWDSITALGPVAGACLAATLPYVSDSESLKASVPTPKEWTSGVPKHVRQARMWRALGLDYETKGGKGGGQYAVPPEEHRHGFHVGQWKHLGDAVGLALWGIREITTAAKR